MDAYKLWVRKNRDLVCSLESLANLTDGGRRRETTWRFFPGVPTPYYFLSFSWLNQYKQYTGGFIAGWVTWILPEHFGNSEVGAEAVYALLGIVSCVNKHIIETPMDGQKQSSIPRALVVSILRAAEAVVEVAAQHSVGDDRKWGFLAVTEAVKACVRLAAFRESGYRMLIQGGEVENEEEDEADIIHRVEVKGVPLINPVNGYSQIGHEEGRAVAAALSKAGQNAKMMSDPMWMQADVMEEVDKQSIWSWKRPLFMFCEAVNIFRPLVYVLMVNKFGIRSWTPWLVSLSVELASLGSHATYLNTTSAERDELKRRKMICALHAMRDPFFTNYTWRLLKKAEEVLNPVPLIFLGKLVYLAEGLHMRYTYTSGS